MTSLLLSGCYVSNDSPEPQSDAAKVSRECLETYGRLLAENFENAPTDDSFESGQWLNEHNEAARKAAFQPVDDLLGDALREWDSETADKLFDEIAKGLR